MTMEQFKDGDFFLWSYKEPRDYDMWAKSGKAIARGGMIVLSLFDGMACGYEALKRAGVPVTKYYASEIKKSAIKVAKENHPNIIHLGDIRNWQKWDIDKPDLIIGGSPCQDFSIAKATKGIEWDYGLNGNKSKLFYTYLDIKNHYNSKWFLLENVKMKKDSKIKLDQYLGVDGELIDSRLFSYQKRARYYWSNIPYDKNIEDKKISFQDYIGIGDKEEARVNKTPSRIKMWNDGNGRTNIKSCTNITNSEKVRCLMRKQDRAPNSGLIQYKDFCRYMTRREMEIAQTVPLGYTDAVSYNQAQDLLGDGWTVDVISHIFKGLQK